MPTLTRQRGQDVEQQNRDRRLYLENQVKKLLIEVGGCLKEIRDFGLYKPDYKSFDSYCQAVYGHNRSWADKQIRAVKVDTTIREVVSDDFNLDNESQARVLSKLTTEELEIVLATAQDLINKGHCKKITANLLQKIVDILKTEKPSSYSSEILQAHEKRLQSLEKTISAVEQEIVRILEWVQAIELYIYAHY